MGKNGRVISYSVYQESSDTSSDAAMNSCRQRPLLRCSQGDVLIPAVKKEEMELRSDWIVNVGSHTGHVGWDI